MLVVAGAHEENDRGDDDRRSRCERPRGVTVITLFALPAPDGREEVRPGRDSVEVRVVEQGADGVFDVTHGGVTHRRGPSRVGSRVVAVRNRLRARAAWERTVLVGQPSRSAISASGRSW
jgi:hypothetical protein